MPKVSTKTPEQQALDKAANDAVKVAKFKELGAKRVNAALDKISLIGNLSNKSSYTYTPEQIEVIKNALIAQCQKTLSMFDANAPVKASGIEL